MTPAKNNYNNSGHASISNIVSNENKSQKIETVSAASPISAHVENIVPQPSTSVSSRQGPSKNDYNNSGHASTSNIASTENKSQKIEAVSAANPISAQDNNSGHASTSNIVSNENKSQKIETVSAASPISAHVENIVPQPSTSASSRQGPSKNDCTTSNMVHRGREMRDVTNREEFQDVSRRMDLRQPGPSRKADLEAPSTSRNIRPKPAIQEPIVGKRALNVMPRRQPAIIHNRSNRRRLNRELPDIVTSHGFI